MASTKLPRGFSSYIATQSLGAFNDNFFKMLIQLFILQSLSGMNLSPEEIASGKAFYIWAATFLFTLPFLIFGPWSGYVADKYSKSNVMRSVKAAEIGIMAFGVFAFYVGNINLVLFVLFLMATQSTFFSPAKYGYIPEACSPEAVTRANGWVEMTTFLSIIAGMIAAGFILPFHQGSSTASAVYAVGFAVLGTISVFFIRKVPAVGTSEPFNGNPLSGMLHDVLDLKKSTPLFLAALANSYFWMIGLLFQTNVVIFAERLVDDERMITLMPAFIAIGIALGSILASRWSGKKVELGLVPMGAIGMALSALVLYFTQNLYWTSSVFLFIGGVSGGLYIVPLYSYLQQRAPNDEKGRVMATTGILNGAFMLIGALLYGLLAVILKLDPATIFVVLGIMTILAVTYICTVIPEYLIRFCAWLLTHTLYRIRIYGEENIPHEGAALLAPNHVTYIDSLLLGSTMQRFIRFIMHNDFFELPLIQNLFRLMQAIPIDPAKGRENVMAALNAATDELKSGHVVCIFPEGKLTRDGEIDEFRTGMETVMSGVDCPIIPVYLGNIWGSLFSWSGGKAILKKPAKLFARIVVHFGEPLPSTTTAAEVESAVRALEAQHRP